MRRVSLGSLMGLVLLTWGTIGCNDPSKQQIQQLTEKNSALDAQNRDLMSQLQASKSQEAAMQMQLASQQGDLTGARARAAQAEAELAKRRDAQTQTKTTSSSGGWEETDRTARVTVGADVLFASGAATLTAAGRKKVDELAATIKQRFGNSTVLVYGHTDGDPIRRTKELWKDNLDLSSNRSMAVTRELIARGIAAKRIETIGMGESHPVTANTTTAGKAKNRRVEIVVLK